MSAQLIKIMSAGGSKRRHSGSALALFPSAKKSRQMGFLGQSRPVRPSASSLRVEGVVRGVATSGTMGPELKIVDNVQAFVNVTSAAPYIASMSSGIAEGVANGQRIGQKCLFKSLDVLLNIQAVPGATVTALTAPAFLDVLVVWDKQPDQTTPAVGTILTTSASNLTFGNTGQTERFVVLRRERYCFDLNTGMSATGKWHVPLSLSAKFPDATAPPNTNDVYIVAVSPNAAPGATIIVPQISFEARLKFTDA